jgi:hypothetical protein
MHNRWSPYLRRLHIATIAAIPVLHAKAYFAPSKLAKFLLKAKTVGFPHLA